MNDLWTGQFGDQYQDRNPASEEEVAKRIVMWRRIFATLPYGDIPRSFLEVGAGQGANLQAIQAIYRHAAIQPELWAMEPNNSAKIALSRLFGGHVFDGEASNIGSDDASYDLVLSYGVLIHIPDSELSRSMSEIYRVSKRWIVSCEYFNPNPVSIPYRGQRDALFKRDYGSIWLDQFNLRPLAYGFEWKRTSGLDNVTWWLFQKVH